MSYELVGLVAICLGAYLGAFVQSFCGRSRLWAWPECNFDDHVPNQSSIGEFHGIL